MKIDFECCDLLRKPNFRRVHLWDIRNISAHRCSRPIPNSIRVRSGAFAAILTHGRRRDRQTIRTRVQTFARDKMIEPGTSPSDIAADQTIIDDLETKFGSNIPAGYTYFGQFVDHDIVDTTSLNQRQVDPDRVLNFRTPRLDLDCVYGRGPGDQPYLYDGSDKGKMLIGGIQGPPERSAAQWSGAVPDQ